jgi:uncharacterized protein YcfL
MVSAVAAVAMIGPVALSGCGSTRAPAVASVQGVTITRAALAHWTRIKNIELQSSSKPTSTSSSVQLEQKALAFLITADWLQAEAVARGVVVSPSEVNLTYQELANGPTGQAFASSLPRRGMTRADELLQLRIQMLTHKLKAKIAAGYNGASVAQIAGYYHAHASQFQGHGHRQQTLAAATPAIRQTLLQAGQEQRVSAFVATFRQRWKGRTTCQPGYVIPECRNGPPLPDSPTK